MHAHVPYEVGTPYWLSKKRECCTLLVVFFFPSKSFAPPILIFTSSMVVLQLAEQPWNLLVSYTTTPTYGRLTKEQPAATQPQAAIHGALVCLRRHMRENSRASSASRASSSLCFGPLAAVPGRNWRSSSLESSIEGKRRLLLFQERNHNPGEGQAEDVSRRH